MFCFPPNKLKRRPKQQWLPSAFKSVSTFGHAFSSVYSFGEGVVSGWRLSHWDSRPPARKKSNEIENFVCSMIKRKLAVNDCFLQQIFFLLRRWDVIIYSANYHIKISEFFRKFDLSIDSPCPDSHFYFEQSFKLFLNVRFLCNLHQ